MEENNPSNCYGAHIIRNIYGSDVYSSRICHIRKGDGVMKRDYIGQPWIGVDLDGTLAYYDGWKGYEHIGEPIPEMRDRVLRWLDEGRDVRIFTARVGPGNDFKTATYCIERWCEHYLGITLPVTCIKDSGMIELWDDRCVQVVFNEGRPVR